MKRTDGVNFYETLDCSQPVILFSLKCEILAERKIM